MLRCQQIVEVCWNGRWRRGIMLTQGRGRSARHAGFVSCVATGWRLSQKAGLCRGRLGEATSWLAHMIFGVNAGRHVAPARKPAAAGHGRWPAMIPSAPTIGICGQRYVWAAAWAADALPSGPGSARPRRKRRHGPRHVSLSPFQEMAGSGSAMTKGTGQ